MSGTLKLSILLCNSRSAIKISNLKIVYATYTKLTLFFENHVHSWTCIEVLRLGNVNHCVLLYWFYNAPGLYGSSVSLAFNQRKRVGQFKRCNNTIKYYVKNDFRKSVENQITIRIYQWYTYIDYNVQLSFNRSLLKALFYTRYLIKFTRKTG